MSVEQRTSPDAEDDAVAGQPRRRTGPAVRIGLLRGRLEVLQFFRARESVVFSFLFPVILLVIFGSIFDQQIAAGVTFTQYFVAGMIAAGLFTTSFQVLAIQIPIERDRGVLKRLAGTPMPRSAYFIGKIIMVLVSSLLEIGVLLTVAALFYDVRLPATPQRWATLAWVVVLGIAACTLCGIAFSSLPREGKRAPAMVTPVALVLQFISGVFFVYTDLPGWMRQIAAIFPLKWLTQGMRSVFLPDSFAVNEPAGAWESGRIALVLAVWVVVGLALCLRTFRWTGRER
jgi:ABC-2 type transport system permease protein